MPTKKATRAKKPAQKPPAVDFIERLAEPDPDPAVQALFANLKASLPRLEALLEDHGKNDEDLVYRFYHQSFKVYGAQARTEAIVEALGALSPHRLNRWFSQIVREGTGKTFEVSHNKRWLEMTRPILEAFFHARYFLEMAVRYGRELDAPPRLMPSGWAALLYLYDLR